MNQAGNQNPSGGAGSNNQNRGNSRPINIQPAQAAQLVQRFRNEVELAKAAGNDRARAQRHYAMAENIKQVLLQYQAQQKAAQQDPTSQVPSSSGPTPSQGVMPQRVPNMGGQDPSSLGQQGMPQNMVGQPAHQSPASGVSTPNMQAADKNTVTVEKFNLVKARLIEFDRRIQQLDARKKTESNVEQVAALDRELTELRSKYSGYQKYAIYMRNQLTEQVRANNPSASVPGSVPAQNLATPTISQDTPSQLQPQQRMATSPPNIPSDKGVQSVSTPVQPQDVSNASNPQNTAKNGKSVSPPGTNASATPSKTSQNPTYGPQVNLSGITKPSVASLPISNTINVKPPTVVTLKANGNNNRPTLTGGMSSGMGPILGSPAITRMPTYDLATTTSGTSIPDNAGRVLTKRKLSELVNTIGADEGDGKTTIDGDVEELLLDLADEFISSVTGFACRLAKHRKADTIDSRDVQLHLERNWNIRIPGYAMDEIKSTRKWQPNPSYNQKLSGIEIAKSVNGNIN